MGAPLYSEEDLDSGLAELASQDLFCPWPCILPLDPAIWKHQKGCLDKVEPEAEVEKPLYDVRLPFILRGKR